eukprot:TRINITY_DN2605_c0_g1_i2.p1 TRINITY_DN2605_c0_g1~~TRINITY_DN2605_c0_g1_i2.p1  ORF type:complete len:485 (-),score=166.64 TRINITY_DN2605_c0_g1_i2:883-2337(-)
MSTPDEDKKAALAEELKATANTHFQAEQYNDAISYYSQAIDLDPSKAVYFANRSISHLRLENFGYALDDASKAIAIDRKYLKAYYRRAAAYMALGKFKLALKDYEAVHKAKPSDKDAKTKFVQCRKRVQQIAFNKAIAVKEKIVSLVESLNLENMAVEESYEGPRLSPDDNYAISKEFMVSLLDYYKNLKVLHKRYAYQMLIDVKNLFMTQLSLVDISVPPSNKFTICGDIHGQFFDLLNIFELNGLPSEENPYLFNGDFVDRGSFSVECIFTLIGFKLLYPNHFFMSRGNHESENMNKMYGFEGEVNSKYSSAMAELFTEVYNWLPLCHRINEKVLVMHGGLFSRNDVTLEEIRQVDRVRQPPSQGIMCELLWSDPQPMLGISPSKRGTGCQFGPDVTHAFLKANNLDYIIRSHEVKEEGYEVDHEGKCITVFSAPNYCDITGNKGAFINLKGDDLSPKYVTYGAVPHPNIKPMAYVTNSFLY